MITHNMVLKTLLLSIIFLLFSIQLDSQNREATSTLEKSLEAKGMVNVSAIDSTFIIDLRYATTNNFTNTILYDSLSIPYLHPLAANKLLKANELLKQEYSNYCFLIFDVARPLSVQKKMYQVVQNTPYAAYVANPARTGLHNYGMAVDLTICDKNGSELDMGTSFDFFGAAAGINKEDELITHGILSHQQVENRKLLRRIMTSAGFLTIRGEWWHFNAVSLTNARNNYEVIK